MNPLKTRLAIGGQKGFAHLFLILFLLVGVILGVYLVGQKQIFKPKAAEMIDPRFINHILETGQSLSLGATSDAGPLSTTQPYSNLMLNDSPDSSTADFEDNSLNYQFIPLVENFFNYESPVSGMANFISAASNNTHQVLATKHGVGGTAYHHPFDPRLGLEKGSIAYNKGINQVRISKKLAETLGRPYRVTALTVIHGETDTHYRTEPEIFNYENNLVQWIGDYNADVLPISGQRGNFPLFTDQMSAYTFEPILKDHPTVALAQLAAAEHNPESIVMVEPKYQYEYEDPPGFGLHMLNESYRKVGEMFGKVYKQVVIDQKPWLPLSPKTITRNENVITVKFNVPVPPIQIDTTQVLLKKNYGFEYEDESPNPPTISKVEVTGPDTVDITLSSNPKSCSAHLRYAYTGVPGSKPGAHEPGSARGNIRDSDTTPSLYGNDLSNWLVHFDKTIEYQQDWNPVTGADTSFVYGLCADIPLAGDFNGDGKDTPEVVRGNVWYIKNENSTGYADYDFVYGNADAQTVTCDWDGDGIDTPGAFADGFWYLKNSNSTGFADITFEYGKPEMKALCGDWDGDGKDSVGMTDGNTIYLKNDNSTGFADLTFVFGNGRDQFIAGDWNGDGKDSIGAFRNGTFYLRNSNSNGFADEEIKFGAIGDTPIAGDWTGVKKDSVGIVRANSWSLKN